MARLCKCYGPCGQKYPQEELTKLNGVNYCHDCYNWKVKETADREALYNCLKETFSLNFPTGLMLRQIKEYHNDRNYTYRNIAFTVDYIVKIKKIKLQMQYGIALVPHYYDEMISYYKNLKEKRESTVIEKQDVVKVKIKPFKFEDDYKTKKLIDMEDLQKNLKEESDDDK